MDDDNHINKVKNFLAYDPGLRVHIQKQYNFDLNHANPSLKCELDREGFLSQKCEEKLKEKRISIAIAPVLMGGAAMFFFLKNKATKLK